MLTFSTSNNLPFLRRIRGPVVVWEFSGQHELLDIGGPNGPVDIAFAVTELGLLAQSLASDDNNFAFGPVTFGPARVEAIPEPGTLLLLTGALTALLAHEQVWRRLKRSSTLNRVLVNHGTETDRLKRAKAGPGRRGAKDARRDAPRLC